MARGQGGERRPLAAGEAVSLDLGLPADKVAVTGDALATYGDRSGASGKPFERAFCSRRGSPIPGRGDAYPGLEFIKAGTLDDPSRVEPAAHIRCAGEAAPGRHRGRRCADAGRSWILARVL